MSEIEPNELLAEQLGLTPGSQVLNQKIGLGSFMGIEIVDGVAYVRVQFPDFESKLPVKLLGERYQVISPDKAASISPIDPAKSEKERRSVLLQAYIQKHQDYTVKSMFEHYQISNQLKKRLSSLLEESKRTGLMFRGDGRHPYAKGAYDIFQGITQSPFQRGFSYDPDTANYGGEGVYVTADVDRAMFYPQDDVMPLGWDQVVYLYFINPRSVIADPVSVNKNDLRDNQILMKAVPPNDIRAAVVSKIGLEQSGNVVVQGRAMQIINNPRYIKEQP